MDWLGAIPRNLSEPSTTVCFLYFSCFPRSALSSLIHVYIYVYMYGAKIFGTLRVTDAANKLDNYISSATRTICDESAFYRMSYWISNPHFHCFNLKVSY